MNIVAILVISAFMALHSTNAHAGDSPNGEVKMALAGVHHRLSQEVGYCGFQGDEDPWTQSPLRICSPDATTKAICHGKTQLVSDSVCTWSAGQCNSKIGTAGDFTCSGKASEGACLSQSYITIVACEWYDPPGEAPSLAPSMLTKTINKYCGFPGDADYMIEPFRECSVVAKTEDACASTLVLESVGCFWESGSCQATKAGFEGLCSFKSTPTTCLSTPAQTFTNTCTWYEVVVESKAFCGFPFDVEPWSYPPNLCSVTAQSAFHCEKTAFLSAAQVCDWDRVKCISDPTNTQVATACTSINGIDACYQYRGSFGVGSCKWFEPPTHHPSAIPSVTPSGMPSGSPSVTPSVSLSPSESPSNTPSVSLNPTTSHSPSQTSSEMPSLSALPSEVPSSLPSKVPSALPSEVPSPEPISSRPTSLPTIRLTPAPVQPAPVQPHNPSPTKYPTPKPPVRLPTNGPTRLPTSSPSAIPTPSPTVRPTLSPTTRPTVALTMKPSNAPTHSPTNLPSTEPTDVPSGLPSTTPSELPTTSPSKDPSRSPSLLPSRLPSSVPTGLPSTTPTPRPSFEQYVPEEVATPNSSERVWTFAAFGVAGACVGGAGCCGAFFWCFKEKKKASPDGNNAGDTSASAFGTSAPKVTQRLRRAISLGSNDSVVALDNLDDLRRAYFENGDVEDTDDFEDVSVDNVIPTGVDFTHKRGVVVVTRSPPGWFFETILRFLCRKKEPVVPASSLDGEEAGTEKSIIVVGSPPGWIWERILYFILFCQTKALDVKTGDESDDITTESAPSPVKKTQDDRDYGSDHTYDGHEHHGIAAEETPTAPAPVQTADNDRLPVDVVLDEDVEHGH